MQKDTFFKFIAHKTCFTDLSVILRLCMDLYLAYTHLHIQLAYKIPVGQFYKKTNLTKYTMFSGMGFHKFKHLFISFTLMVNNGSK